MQERESVISHTGGRPTDGGKQSRLPSGLIFITSARPAKIEAAAVSSLPQVLRPPFVLVSWSLGVVAAATVLAKCLPVDVTPEKHLDRLPYCPRCSDMGCPLT